MCYLCGNPVARRRQQPRKTFLAAAWALVLFSPLSLLPRQSPLGLAVAETAKDQRQSPDPHPLDVVALVRKAVANYNARMSRATNYVYVEHDNRRDGEVRVSNTYEIMSIEGQPFRRHIEFNGLPLPPEEEKEERARLAAVSRRLSIPRLDEGELQPQSTEPTRVGASPDPRIAAIQSFEEQYRNSLAGQAAKIRESMVVGQSAPPLVLRAVRFHNDLPELPLERLADEFDVRFNGRELLNGRDTYVVEARPKRAPKGADEIELEPHNFRLKIWVDRADSEFARVEGKAIQTGLLSRTVVYSAMDSLNLSKELEVQERKLLAESRLSYGPGTLITMEWEKLNDEVWLPTRIHMKGDQILAAPYPRGQNIVFESLRYPVEHEAVFSSYKKFHVEYRILPPN